MQTLEARQLPLDQDRCRALTPLTHPGGELGHEAVAIIGVADQIGVGRVGRGREVEEVECATERSSQVRSDRRHDAAGGTGDEENGVLPDDFADDLAGFVGVGERAVRQAYAPASTLGVANLDTAGIAKRFVDQHIGQRRRFPARPGSRRP